MLKNKIFTIILMLVLASPVYSNPEELDTSEPVTQIEQEEASTLQNELEEINTIDYKQPVSKKKIIKKFLLAMSGVAASSMILFVGLSLYNRIREGFVNQQEIGEKEVSLETPENLTDAVRTFLDKTKWE